MSDGHAVIRRWVTGFVAGLCGLIVANVASAGVLDASPDAPWDRAQAAHLLRRAGFGGTPEEIDALVRLGRDKAVDSLVDYEKIDTDGAPYPRGEAIRNPGRGAMQGLDDKQRRGIRRLLQTHNRQHIQALRQWWLRRMVTTKRPLEEKMTLFWHGHFTSGFREVKDWRALYDQNEFLRRNALGDFRTLLVGISKDPAMLRYLDNARNVKRKPNENYARELMELFTLGEGNYTEQDVKEAARAFTGWGLGRGQQGFAFRRRQHDFGDKRFLDRQGAFDGTDIISILLEQPAASRYMAGRLWEFFAEHDPDPAIVEGLAAVLRHTGFSFRETMRALLRSDAFYADRVMRSQIKSPIELVVGSARMLETGPSGLDVLAQASRQMGQELFQPPNVKGWDGGRKWINTSTLYLRYNFAAQLLSGPPKGRRGHRDRGAMMANPERRKARIREVLDGLPESNAEQVGPILARLESPPAVSEPRRPYDARPTLERHGLRTPRQIVDHYVDRLLQTRLDDEKLATLAATLTPSDRPFKPRDQSAAARVRELVALMMSMPEYQLN